MEPAKITEYRTYAERCSHKSEMTSDADSKLHLQAMAEGWQVSAMTQFDPAKVLESASRAAQETLKGLAISLAAAKSEAAAKGRLNNGGHIKILKGFVETTFKESCTALCVRIAEICGDEAPSYANSVGEFLPTLIPPTIGLFLDGAAPGQRDPHTRDLAEKLSLDLASELNAIALNSAIDLGLGIAGGINVAKRKSGVNIDNSGSAEQLVVNSNDRNQLVGRDQTTNVNDLTLVFEVLIEIRNLLKTANLSALDAEEIYDAIVMVEREVEAPQQNAGRARRLLSSLARKLEAVGINAGSQPIIKLVTAALS